MTSQTPTSPPNDSPNASGSFKTIAGWVAGISALVTNFGSLISDYLQAPVAARVATALAAIGLISWNLARRSIRSREAFPGSPRSLGARPYGAKDADLFWGREIDVARILAWLDKSSSAILTLYGESGSGKTSLLRAGIIPGLGDNWRAEYVDHYSLEAIDRVSSLVSSYQIRRNGDRLLVVFDQMERHFIGSGNALERSALVKTIESIRVDSDIRLIISIRADHLSALSRLASDNSLISNSERLDFLERNAARRIVLGAQPGSVLSQAEVDRVLESFSQSSDSTLASGLIHPLLLQIFLQLLEQDREQLGSLRELSPRELVRVYLLQVTKRLRDRDLAARILLSLIDLPTGERTDSKEAGTLLLESGADSLLYKETVRELEAAGIITGVAQSDTPAENSIMIAHDFLVSGILDAFCHDVEATGRPRRLIEFHRAESVVYPSRTIPALDCWRILRSNIRLSMADKWMIRRSLRRVAFRYCGLPLLCFMALLGIRQSTGHLGLRQLPTGRDRIVFRQGLPYLHPLLGSDEVIFDTGVTVWPASSTLATPNEYHVFWRQLFWANGKALPFGNSVEMELRSVFEARAKAALLHESASDLDSAVVGILMTDDSERGRTVARGILSDDGVALLYRGSDFSSQALLYLARLEAGENPEEFIGWLFGCLSDRSVYLNHFAVFVAARVSLGDKGQMILKEAAPYYLTGEDKRLAASMFEALAAQGLTNEWLTDLARSRAREDTELGSDSRAAINYLFDIGDKPTCLRELVLGDIDAAITQRSGFDNATLARELSWLIERADSTEKAMTTIEQILSDPTTFDQFIKYRLPFVFLRAKADVSDCNPFVVQALRNAIGESRPLAVGRESFVLDGLVDSLLWSSILTGSTPGEVLECVKVSLDGASNAVRALYLNQVMRVVLRATSRSKSLRSDTESLSVVDQFALESLVWNGLALDCEVVDALGELNRLDRNSFLAPCGDEWGLAAAERVDDPSAISNLIERLWSVEGDRSSEMRRRLGNAVLEATEQLVREGRRDLLGSAKRAMANELSSELFFRRTLARDLLSVIQRQEARRFDPLPDLRLLAQLAMPCASIRGDCEAVPETG